MAPSDNESLKRKNSRNIAFIIIIISTIRYQYHLVSLSLLYES